MNTRKMFVLARYGRWLLDERQPSEKANVSMLLPLIFATKHRLAESALDGKFAPFKP